jgi:hypothetical protein
MSSRCARVRASRPERPAAVPDLPLEPGEFGPGQGRGVGGRGRLAQEFTEPVHVGALQVPPVRHPRNELPPARTRLTPARRTGARRGCRCGGPRPGPGARPPASGASAFGSRSWRRRVLWTCRMRFTAPEASMRSEHVGLVHPDRGLEDLPGQEGHGLALPVRVHRARRPARAPGRRRIVMCTPPTSGEHVAHVAVPGAHELTVELRQVAVVRARHVGPGPGRAGSAAPASGS